jgi:hypothetical protein
MQPSKPAKSIVKDKNGSPSWLSLGFICLLVLGIIGAKVLLIVDKDLEVKTKFVGKNWQLNSQSIGQYVNIIDRFTEQHLNYLGRELHKKLTQIIDSTRNSLSHPQNVCVSVSELSTVLDLAQQKISRVTDEPTPTNVMISPLIKQPPVSTTPTSQQLCITNGVKK